MAKTAVKKWTVLYYANGNNEYEPEMYGVFDDLARAGSDDDINIVMEIGRIDRSIARMIRVSEVLPKDDIEWTGVRRYYISKPSSCLLKELKDKNLADPRNLYNFLSWGMENYPAQHYMVILGGRGTSFAGTMADYSQDHPYMMGTFELCEALNMINKNIKKKIDILVLDICYMNFAEILYELGKSRDNTVQNVITYIGQGPICGLPMERLASLVKENLNTVDTHMLIEKILNSIDLNLAAFEINHSKLKKIKSAANDLAYSYLSSYGEKRLTAHELLTVLNPDDPWYENAVYLQKVLSSLILFYNNKHSNQNDLINIICSIPEGLANSYCKLGFTMNNYWVNLISNKGLNYKFEFNNKKSFKPIILGSDGLRSLIESVNPSLPAENIDIMLEALISSRGWSWEDIDIKTHWP